ncbi:MAG: methyl-accepting chemotaxis protein [Clostridia bacterium]|nr:methyl-accepting chemotaxis protein [Clostridia bacterium]
MSKLEIMKKNEDEVNNIILRINKWFFIVFPTCMLLNFLKVIMIPWNFAALICLIGIPICSIPLLYRLFRFNMNYFKYVAMMTFLIMQTVLYGISYMTVVFFWLLPIAFACLYFDKRLLITTFISLIPAVLAGELMAAQKQIITEAKLSWIPLHMISFLIQFLIIAPVFVSFVKRANKMLFTSGELLERLEKQFSENEQSSLNLVATVKQLFSISDEANHAINRISASIHNLESESASILENAASTNKNVDSIVEDVTLSVTEAENVILDVHNMANLSKENKNELSNSLLEMQKIEASAEESKKIIQALSDQANEILNVANIITGISSRTNLLSLNASIEAAKAGDAGKGFSVVAQEVRKLSEQVGHSALTIKEMLDRVNLSINQAVYAITDTYKMVSSGLELTQKTVTNFDRMLETQRNIMDKVQNMARITQSFKGYGDLIRNTMISIKDENENSHLNISQISSAIEKLFESFNDIISTINRVEKEAAALTSQNSIALA